MGRKKIKLQFIEDSANRKVTYNKRVKGIVKKTQELSVMCGVDACCVIYGPYSPAPVVWPSCEEEAKRVLTNFKQNPDLHHAQRQFDQDAFLKESIAKAKEKLMKLRRRNRVLEMENLITDVMYGRKKLEDVKPTDLGDMLRVLEDKSRGIEHRLSMCKNKEALPLEANNNNNNGVDGNVNEGGDLGAGEGASTSNFEDDYGLSAIVKQSLTISSSSKGKSIV